MARRRFIADEVHGDTAVLTGQNAAHLSRVLRVRVGKAYEIAADGVVRLGTVRSVADDRVEFELGGRIESAAGVGPVTLLVAIFKFDRFEWAIEKATELGIARIVPVIARRTDAHLAQAAATRVARWRRIAHEASQQSRRVVAPEIGEPVKLKDAAANVSGVKILLAETEEERTLRSLLAGTQPESITLAIGPEGGWSDDELQLFANNGWLSVKLGPTILRAETAVVAGVAVVNAMTA